RLASRLRLATRGLLRARVGRIPRELRIPTHSWMAILGPVSTYVADVDYVTQETDYGRPPGKLGERLSPAQPVGTSRVICRKGSRWPLWWSSHRPALKAPR